MFFQRQAFLTEKKPDFFLAFFDCQKKSKVFIKSQNFKIWLQKSQIGSPVLMNLLSHSLGNSKDPNKNCCNKKLSKCSNLVEICNQLTKEVKNYRFLNRSQSGEI